MDDLARESMIELLEADGALTDPDVSEAMRNVDRELFLDDASRGFAYALQDVQVTDHVIALNPRTIAELLSVARPTKSMRVLLLGTSTGYVEALLSHIGCVCECVEPNESQRAYVTQRLASFGRPLPFIELSEARTYDCVLSLKSLPNLEPRVLGLTPYGRTMLVIGEDHTLIALDFRGDPTHPDVSYSGSIWVPFFDPPLFDE